MSSQVQVQEVKKTRKIKGKRLTIRDYESCVGCGLCMLACSRRQGYLGFGKSAIVVRSMGGFERGFSIIVCRLCQDPPCVRACPMDAIERRGIVLFVNYDKCIGCRRCAEACIVGAIQWDEEQNKPLICTHCGFCAMFCPHNVLTVQEIEMEIPEE
ncbi:MAG: [Fe-S]-binding protein [Crenarchaeota archaeon]|jgi:Fe-S-cluster-containing dehydrogenase component|nr:[Fe-S]-binding protein [Thermoproteota archaeon]